MVMKRKSKKTLFEVIILLSLINDETRVGAESLENNTLSGCKCAEKEYEYMREDYSCYQCRSCSGKSVIVEMMQIGGRPDNSLCIRDSNLHEIPDRQQLNITILDLAHNNINGLQQLHLRQSPDLVVLSLADNWIPVLHNGVFDRNLNLRSLHLQNNVITIIEDGVFTLELKITYINLSNNLLKSVDIWPLLLPSVKPVGSADNLHVNLAGNLISEVTNNNSSSIYTIRDGAYATIQLSRNHLQYISKFDIIKLLEVSRWNDLLRMRNFVVDVTDNPLHCDCDMYAFINFTRPFFSYYVELPGTRDFHNVKCSTPTPLYEQLVASVDPESFQCDEADGCPRGCTCTRTAYNRTLVVVCDRWTEEGLPFSLPLAESIKLFIAERNLVSLGDRPYLINLTTLDVGYNDIQAIDPVALRRMNKMRRLLLAGNNIRYIPRDFAGQNFVNLVQINLVLNNFECDCNNLWFKHWLINHHDLIERPNLVVCDDSSVLITSQLDSEFKCHNKNVSAFLITVGIWNTIIICMIGVGVMLYRFRWQLKFLALYKLRWFFQRNNQYYRSVDDTKQDHSHMYDAFVCYAGDDSEWVTDTLTPSLEKKQFKLCLHERDFCIGRRISHNVVDSVQNSKCIVIVLSKSFIESEWCQFEFNMAISHEKKKDGVIVVVLDKSALLYVPSHPGMYQHIQTYTWLDPLEPLFWQELQTCMENGYAPTKDEYKPPEPYYDSCHSENEMNLSFLPSSGKL